MSQGSEQRSIWSRDLALYGAAWVPFLSFPVYDLVLDHQLSHPMRIIAMILVIGYGCTHLFASQVYPPHTSREHSRPRLLVLLVLTAIAVGVALISIRAGLGLFPFVAAWAVFNLSGSRRWLVPIIALAVEVRYALNARDFTVIWLVLLTAICAVAGLVAELMVRRANEVNEAKRRELLIAERDRMARDVHDLLGHSLTMVGLKVQLAERLVDSAPDRAKAELVDAHRAITVAIGDVRRTVEGVHVTTLEEAVTRARRALTDAGLTVEVTGDLALVHGKVAIALSWVVQELATNIVRHANATHVWMKFDSSSVVITDNGSGLVDSTPGNGMRGMQERLTSVGATFDVSSLEAPHNGTRTVVNW